MIGIDDRVQREAVGGLEAHRVPLAGVDLNPLVMKQVGITSAIERDTVDFDDFKLHVRVGGEDIEGREG